MRGSDVLKRKRRLAVPLRSGVHLRRKRKRKLRLSNEGKIIAACAAAVVILLLFFIVSAFSSKDKTVKISLADFAAFRVPFSSLSSVYSLSEKYTISFSKLLTIYSLDNRFFPPDLSVTDDLYSIERNYILNYDSIDEKYPQDKYSEYYSVINAIFSEIKAFPVHSDFTGEDYMFGNSFGTERTSGEKGTHYGTDITDRENIRGRISIISMTDGYISDTGWNEKDGYYVSVVTYNSTLYYYAHFDSIASGLKKGDIVNAGQILGKMGDTGLSKIEGGSKNFPVHLHLGIAPKTTLTKDVFWINPYNILRFAELRFTTNVVVN